MFGLFKKEVPPEVARAEKLYSQLLSASRMRSFYAEMQVPDTVDGRFEMISLHAALIMLRLEQLEPASAQNLSQALFDHMFRDMEYSLREMGVGDLSVPKQMKRMLHGFNGRAQAYKKALQEPNTLDDAIRRNIYGTLEEIDTQNIVQMSEYIRKTWNRLKDLPLENFQNSDNLFERGAI